MATNLNESTTTNTNKTLSTYRLNRSLERAFDEATQTGELILNGRELRDIPNYTSLNNKCDLSDTVLADLSRNHFTEFPRILCSFFSLENLNLYHNAIKSIPDQIIQIRMLKILDLSRNQLAFIPPSLCKLPYLEVLIIHNNKLISLPEEIGQLKQLIELDVSSNDLTQIPYQIGSLSNLRTLNIRRNMINEIPIELCNLKLINFDCSLNRIVRLPLNLREMVSLIELNVEHNPLETPPASICTLGLLHIMRYLLFEAIKDEKRRGLLTEHEINTKYRNSFSYQGSRHVQCGKTVRNTVVSSDSGYLTTEGSEKANGDDDSVQSMSNEHSLRSEPTLMLTLADEFSKELARQKNEYEKKKNQAQQLKIHLLQQLGETESQRAKTRELARRIHDEKLAKMEKQREDARRKMENSKNIQLFNKSTKERLHQSTLDDLSLNSNRKMPIDLINSVAGVDEILINNENHHCQLHEQKSLHNYNMTRQCNSSENIHRLISSSYQNGSDQINDIQYKHFNESRLTKLKCFDNYQINLKHKNEDYLKIEQMRKTIEERLKLKLPDDIGYALSDGVVLCHFINQIRPRSVQSIHVPSQAVPKLSLAKCRRNIENFLEASRQIGVPEADLCSVQDIIDEKNPTRLARQLHLLISPQSFEQTSV